MFIFTVLVNKLKVKTMLNDKSTGCVQGFNKADNSEISVHKCSD